MAAVRTKPALVRQSSLIKTFNPARRVRRYVRRDNQYGRVAADQLRIEPPDAHARTAIRRRYASDGAVIWARTDRPARMLVEASTTDTFQVIRASAVVDAFPETDFTAKVALDGLPAGKEIFYRVRFQDHATPTIISEPQTGSFRTAPLEPRTVSFVVVRRYGGAGLRHRYRSRRHAHVLDHAEA